MAICAEVDAKLLPLGLRSLAGPWLAPWDQRALLMRDALRASSDIPYLVEERGDEHRVWSTRDDVRDEINEEAREIRERDGPAQAERFISIASDAGLSIGAAQADWLTELRRVGGVRPGTIAGHVAAMKLLAQFLKDRHQFPSLDVAPLCCVTGRVAGQFIDWRVGTISPTTKRAIHPSTVHRELSSVSGLWRWAKRDEHVEANPWIDQRGRLPKQRQPDPLAVAEDEDEDDDPTKRPYSVAEMVALVRADGRLWAPNGSGYGAALWDTVRLGLLTGCRASELTGLRFRDVVEDGTAISLSVGRRGGKSENATRRIPLCALAQRVLATRMASLPLRGPRASLWPEIPAQKDGGGRGKRLSTRFGNARDRVLATVQGERNPLGVDLHSLRRSFAAGLRDAMHSG